MNETERREFVPEVYAVQDEIRRLLVRHMPADEVERVWKLFGQWGEVLAKSMQSILCPACAVRLQTLSATIVATGAAKTNGS